MTSLEIILDETGNKELEDVIKQGVIDYNIPYLGLWDSKPFAFYIKNDKGKVIAGIYGYYLKKRLLGIEYFWVEGEYRHQKLGTKLLKSTEDFARLHKCPTVDLYTMDFQAQGFYEKHGFVLLGTIPKWRFGYDAHFMSKVL